MLNRRDDIGKFSSTVVATLLALAVLASPAHAIPTLQLYIEGSSYDRTDESWVFRGDDFKLWVLGDVGSYGPIVDVKLTMAFAAGLTGWSVQVVPTTATLGQVPGAGDPSTSPGGPALTPISMPLSTSGSGDPCIASASTDGRLPCLGDGTKLPGHGEYGPGIQWVEFALGDLTLTDSPIGDYGGATPTSFPSVGQINAYEIHLSGFPANTTLHFDAFDHIGTDKTVKTIFAPLSHDGSVIDAPVPQPSSLTLLGGAILVLSAVRIVRRLR
jgi:hypothetical protein